jgi:hypothetical protein
MNVFYVCLGNYVKELLFHLEINFHGFWNEDYRKMEWGIYLSWRNEILVSAL